MQKNTSDAAAIIKRDHAAVKKDYAAFKKAKTQREKRTIALRIFDALDAHAKMEEQIFYPVVVAEGKAREVKMIIESREEHKEMKHLIERFRKPIKEEREGMGMRIEELLAGVLHHAGEEEKELLPATAKTLGKERMKELGAKMERMSPTRRK